MAGIAGIANPSGRNVVDRMLERIAHRGPAGRDAFITNGVTLGGVWPAANDKADIIRPNGVADWGSEGHYAKATVAEGRLVLTRDPLGVSPLYYGRTPDGALCFASEVKALLEATRDVNELPAGCTYDGKSTERYFELKRAEPLAETDGQIAKTLHSKLDAAIQTCIRGEIAGSWLSGGLDSSVIAALARRHVRELHTVAAGVAGAPDLSAAREVADYLKTRHHEVVLTVADMISILPKVIEHLESFDALLVRSSVMNYRVAQEIARHSPATFSGEAGDELFAGYEYLKTIALSGLADELIDITNRLHNTALQRVDRSAASAGLLVHVPFTAPDVVDYAVRIPVEYKLHKGVEKWILRRALDGGLPPSILARPKAKFWEGSGVAELLARHAESRITDADFSRERTLENGWTLSSKEELLYYRLFKEHFGTAADLSWMGRTKTVAT